VPPTIGEIELDRVDELRELWLQLHEHHQSVSPVQPFVDDETSWTTRRRGYVEILGSGGFALAARVDGELAGYAVVRMHDGPDDSWQLGDRYAEVWTLVVDKAHRGDGIGTALLDEIDSRLEAQGVHGLVIGAMEGNEGAIRLYERRGLTRGWVQLYRTAPPG
jgi:ribosomal protein S18 acetylase RimI-like enzyme